LSFFYFSIEKMMTGIDYEEPNQVIDEISLFKEPSTSIILRQPHIHCSSAAWPMAWQRFFWGWVLRQEIFRFYLPPALSY